MKNDQVSSTFAAAINGQVSSTFAAAKNGQVSSKFAAAKNGQLAVRLQMYCLERVSRLKQMEFPAQGVPG